MKEGTYKVVLEFELLRELKPETLEAFFHAIMDKSGSLVLLNMATPIAADSDQAIMESILVEGIRKAMADESFGRVLSYAGGFDINSFNNR